MQEEKKTDYLKYSEELKKVNFLSLITCIVTLLAALAVVFLPIFKCSVEKEITLKDFNGDYKAYSEFLQTLDPEQLFDSDGIIRFEENVSMYDEIKKAIDGFDVELEEDTPAEIITILFLIFPAFLVASGISKVYASSKGVYACIKNMKDLDTYAKLEYSTAKTGTDTTGVFYYLLSGGVTSLVAFPILSVIASKFMKRVFSSTDAPFEAGVFSYLSGYEGITIWGIFAIALIVVCFILEKMWLKQKEKLSAKILTENCD